MLAVATDSQRKKTPTIFLYNVPEEFNPEEKNEPLRVLSVPDTQKICDALWTSLNDYIIAGYDDGTVRKWDVQDGTVSLERKEHKKGISSIQFSADKTMFITASLDNTAKLWDTKTLEVLKTYVSDRPLNAAAISPIMNHVILGGGQEAMHVTTSVAQMGHFEVDFIHLVYGEFLGSVKGHFGPVHTLAFSPDGKSYTSGSEDGYVRVHKFPQSYFDPKDVQIGVKLKSDEPPPKKEGKKDKDKDEHRKEGKKEHKAKSS